VESVVGLNSGVGTAALVRVGVFLAKDALPLTAALMHCPAARDKPGGVPVRRFSLRGVSRVSRFLLSPIRRRRESVLIGVHPGLFSFLCLTIRLLFQ
jgi:hypothetical protein